MKSKWFKFGPHWYYTGNFSMFVLEQAPSGSYYWIGVWKKSGERTIVTPTFPNEDQANYYFVRECLHQNI